MNMSMRTILVDMLVDMAQRLRNDPEDRNLLVEGVTLYHIIIEGTMALAGQRQMLEQCRKRNLFPAFRGGFTAVARDESRHVIFGVKVLRDIIQEDHSYAYTVYKALEMYAPVALDALAPVDAFIPSLLERREDPIQQSLLLFSCDGDRVDVSRCPSIDADDAVDRTAHVSVERLQVVGDGTKTCLAFLKISSGLALMH